MHARLVFLACLMTLLTACDTSKAVLPGEGLWRFVNYWAIWCGPCREEIPVLNAINQRADVQVLGVNFDGVQAKQLSDQIAQLGIAFDNLSFDPATLLTKTRPQVLPTTWLLSPDGTIVATLVGPQTEATLLAALRDAQQ